MTDHETNAFVEAVSSRTCTDIENLTSRREFLKAAGTGTVLMICGYVLAGCGASPSPKLSVEPLATICDEPFVVRLTGLAPGDRVTLSASFEDASGQEWSSAAIFEADGEGVADTSGQRPVEGSYDIRDPMGLVWSAVGPGAGYLPPIQPSPVTITASVGDEEISVRAQRRCMAVGVETTEVREDGLVGTFFSMPDGGPRPAVLVFGGSEGGLSPYIEREAALLASHGYAALALAYFRGGQWGEDLPDSLPETLENVPLEYFGGALQWLARRDVVDGERFGVVGHSRGGELALLLGATYPERVGAVVSYVGSGIVIASPEGDAPAWTFRGAAVPYLTFADDQVSVSDEELARAEIPVDEIRGPILLMGAGEDTVWPSGRLSRLTYERIERLDRPYQDELAVYPEAGHGITAPYVPVGSATVRYGGIPEANARANEDAWRRTKALLDRALMS